MNKQRNSEKQQRKVDGVFCGNFYAFARQNKRTRYDNRRHQTVKGHTETSYKEVRKIFKSRIKIPTAKSYNYQNGSQGYADNATDFFRYADLFGFQKRHLQH